MEIVGPICGYKARGLTEAEADRILYAYLLGGYGAVSRQHPTQIAGTNNRLDFRFCDKRHRGNQYGGNPCILELAVKDIHGGQHLTVIRNKTELRKLSRHGVVVAARVLLLLDVSENPTPKDKLIPGYDKYHFGPGKFAAHGVSVLYVHRDLQYKFVWRPRR